MTRIAVIADVHGNAPALDAVLAEVEQESPDLVVLAGDAAGGLWQGAVLDRLMALNRARFVRGNVDRVIVRRGLDVRPRGAHAGAEGRSTRCSPVSSNNSSSAVTRTCSSTARSVGRAS
jgi:predicted phosphodiesterase